MTRLLVVSDSHGASWKLSDALEFNPGARWVFHLGDGEDEADNYLSYLPGKLICRVRGNGDSPYGPALSDVVTIEGVTVYACHGHMEGVKRSLDRLAFTAKSKGASLALFGHTHEPFFGEKNGVLLFNPGSLFSGSYGVIDVDKGEITAKHYRLD